MNNTTVTASSESAARQAVDYAKTRPRAERRASAKPAATATTTATAKTAAPARTPLRIGKSVRRSAPLQGRAQIERSELLRDAILPGFAGKLKIWLAITCAAALSIAILSLSGNWTGLAEIGLTGAIATAIWMARKYRVDRSPWRLQAGH
jgi:hypothetical protein